MTDQFAKRVTMVKAQPGDLEFYIDLLEAVAHWLRCRGLSPLPSGIYRESSAYYSDSIIRGEVYLACLANEVVGALRLVANDGIVWPVVEGDPAIYLENLVVSRAWSNRGLGREMLAWAERQAAMAGKTYLRLDCFANNAVLRNYYENSGYSERGEVDACYPFGTLRLQRYERDVQAR